MRVKTLKDTFKQGYEAGIALHGSVYWTVGGRETDRIGYVFNPWQPFAPSDITGKLCLDYVTVRPEWRAHPQRLHGRARNDAVPLWGAAVVVPVPARRRGEAVLSSLRCATPSAGCALLRVQAVLRPHVPEQPGVAEVGQPVQAVRADGGAGAGAMEGPVGR